VLRIGEGVTLFLADRRPLQHLVAAEDRARAIEQVRHQQAALGQQQVVHVDLPAVAVRDQHVFQHLVSDVGDRRVDGLAIAIGADQQVQPDDQRNDRRHTGSRNRPKRNLFGERHDFRYQVCCSCVRKADREGSSSCS
jgi:hypothetical protein